METVILTSFISFENYLHTKLNNGRIVQSNMFAHDLLSCIM